MSPFARLLVDTNAVVFMLLAAASIREYRRGRGSAPAWAATAFTMIGAVAALALLPSQPAPSVYNAFWYQVFVRVVLAVLIAFPYCLFRIAVTFRPPSKVVRLGVDIVTGGLIVAFFAAPRLPAPGEDRPAWVAIYTIALIIQWTATSLYAALSLWKAGAGRPTAARYRMRLLGAATAALTAMIYVSVLLPQKSPNKPSDIYQLMELAVGIAYFIGLAPPRALITYWQRPEQEAARFAMSRLMAAVTASEVAETVLPHVAALIGAQSATLYNKDGSLFASFGELPPGGEIDDGRSETSGELRAQLDNGGAIVVRSNTYSTLFGADRIGVLQWFADLTDLALARCAAIAREREFISNAAHELRTPLTTMTGLAAMLAADRVAMDEAQIDRCIEGLVRQGNRARELVNTLLDMAQIERGTVSFADDVIDLSDVVGDSLDFTPAPSDRDVTIRVADDVRVRGDAERLEQVVVNLLTNAYRHGGKSITIEAHDECDGIVLSIADDGDGVPSDLVPRLFDPFSRGATANGTGSGLGLAICRRIVEALGGSISYDPTPEWRSRFKVELRKAA